ncbi:hypothetical protein [Kutzneria chonburiensis]|uniref:Uncharacterized protein n=1 Tax=Kutzneria chonburiensis TaxID=1483604 RepID=A0ABV6N5U1_9PSEU|nr:hypothetical protein [Kutzneria chonburiensis]
MDTLVGLTVAEAVEYRSEIENAPAEQGFYRLRQARVAVVGEGPALGTVLRAGLGSGWRQTRVFTTGSVPEYALRDEFQHVLTDQVDRIDAHLAETDLVVHVSSDFAELIEMGRRCRAANVSLTQVFIRDRDAWITPVHAPGGRPTEAAWRRLVPEDEPAVLPKRVPGALMAAAYEGRLDKAGAVFEVKVEVEAVTAALIGAQVSLTCFRYLTGTTPTTEPTLLRLDRDTLEITEHRYQWGGPVGAAPSAEPLTPGELLDRLPAFVDRHVGLLSAVEQAGVVSWATVADPLRRWPAHRVLAWANDAETAKVRAVLAAMASYGALAAGRGWAWGTDLITGARRRVFLDQSTPHAEVGVAAGLCWDDAVAAGLQAHHEQHVDPMTPVRRWVDDTTPSDVDDLAKTLATATGRTPVAVPLDADPAAARLLPFVTQIVLV